MAFKFIAFFGLLSVASCGVLPGGQIAYAAPAVVSAPVVHKTLVAQPTLVKRVDTVDDYDPHPQYSFSYDIHDSLTGDLKSQSESRDGDVVKGQYSLLEADGTRRIVDYTADPVHGFNAVVHKEGTAVAHKTVVAAPVTKIVSQAPVVAHKVLAPTAYVHNPHPHTVVKTHY